MDRRLLTEKLVWCFPSGEKEVWVWDRRVSAPRKLIHTVR